MTKIKTHWVKTTPFGNYEDTSDRNETSAHTHIIREAKVLGIAGKHAGSKPISKFLKVIARAHKAMAPAKVMDIDEQIQMAEEMKEN